MILLLSILALWHGVSSNAIFKGQVAGNRSTDIVYKIGDISRSPTVTPTNIKEGLAFLEANTCINFIDWNDAPEREVNLPIQNGPPGACRINEGVFELDDCISSRKTMQHEVTHFLGFCHTQNREDWKDHIEIIPNEYFDTYDDARCESVPSAVSSFDHGSGMFQNLAPLAKPLDEGFASTLGQSIRFAFSDYRSINWLFNCAGKCTTHPPCENGGYTHPRDCNKCMCNKYYIGDLCETPRNLVTLSCESNRHYSKVINVPQNNATLRSMQKLKDDFMNRGDDLWDIIEAPDNVEIQVEIESSATRYSTPCAKYAVEVNDGDLNLVGKMFCDDPNYKSYKKFTAKSNRLGLHMEYAEESATYLSAKFTLIGCDDSLPATTTSSPTM